MNQQDSPYRIRTSGRKFQVIDLDNDEQILRTLDTREAAIEWLQELVPPSKERR